MKTFGFCLFGLMLAGSALAQEEISVRVCNGVRMPEPTLEAAKKHADYVLNNAGIQVKWLDCSTKTMEREMGPRDFILTLAGFRPSNKKGQFYKQTMGGTWDVDRGTKETSLTVYFHAVEEFVNNHGEDAQVDVVLGYAIAHEFGHLFMGKQHTDNGVMRPAWGKKDLELMRHNYVHFSAPEQQRIQDELRARDQAWSSRTTLASAK